MKNTNKFLQNSAARRSIEYSRDIFAKIPQFVGDDSGAAAIEYGQSAVQVLVTAIGALTAMGNSLSTMFSTLSSALRTVASGR